jgi:hypothetical protein
MRSATVVLPVPGAPVKHMCRFGRDADSPNRWRARSTSSSEPISATFFFTGSSPTSSLSRLARSSSMPASLLSLDSTTVPCGSSASPR